MSDYSLIDQKTDCEEALKNLMHELRSINRVIKFNSSELCRLLKNDNFSKEKLDRLSSEIFDNSQILTLLLDITDYELNPKLIIQQPKISTSVHGIFYKSAITFNRVGKQKKIRVKLKGEVHTQIDLYPIFGILPYLLLDNAIKYSAKDSVVEVNFSEISNSISVDVISIGPILTENEKLNIKNKGVRGKYASQLFPQGSGRGLALAEYICILNDVSLSIISKDQIFNLNNCPFGEFKVTINIPKM